MGVPVVLCPLEVERRAIAKAVGMRARVLVTGPGSLAITPALEAILPVRVGEVTTAENLPDFRRDFCRAIP